MDSPEPTHTQNSPREQQYDAFVALLARHDLAVRRFVRTLLPTQDGVDDVMQETALECWKKFGDFQSSESDSEANEFVRWACVIARYKSMSWQRDKSRDRLVFRESVIEQLSLSAMESVGQQEQQRRAVEACLSELPPDQRRLVLSVHSPNESIARIANETGQQARKLYTKVNQLRSLLLVCVERRLAAEPGNG